MIEQIKIFAGNALAIEVIDGFTEMDKNLSKKFFDKKIEKGHEYVNLLVKLDEMKISHSSTKAFMGKMILVLRNYKRMGNIAIVAHSKILKTLVPVDNFFFERLRKGYEEKYFDISQMDEAILFLEQKK
jgi:hypothetical protein